MRRLEPIITTGRTGDAIVVAVRYETPEGLRAIYSLRGLAASALGIAGAAATALLLAAVPASLSGGEGMVVWLAGVGVAVGIGREFSSMLADRRFWLRDLMDHRLEVRLTRDAVVARGERFARTGKIAFTSEPHRQGRIEERGERVSGEILHEVYRRAHEVRLQHGERLIVLAAVSDDEAANTIARRLQAADEEAVRGGTFDADRVFGERPAPA